MSSNKRPLDWLGVRGSGGSSKRAKSPAPQTTPTAASNPNQSSDLPSTSSSTNIPQPGAHTLGKTSKTEYAILSTLKGSMKFLIESCQVFPPLGSAVGTLVDVLESIEIAKHSDEELCAMASDLPQWAMVLSTYLSNSQPERMSKWVQKLADDLVEHAECIRTQQRHMKMRRLGEFEQETEELMRSYRRIETSFRQLQADTGLSTWKIADDHLKDSRLNGLSPAHDARYDSSFSDKIERGGCFQNTRVLVLETIRDWIHGMGHTKIYWTNGMAGTGKTTIAYSVCAELNQIGRLGASFFCSRASSECQDVSRILPTIAYQLAQQFYPFRSSLCGKLSQEPNIGQRSISVQFEYLIKAPLLEVKDLLPKGLVVVIDALDECSDPKTVEAMLDALFHHVANLPIRFFLASRPEPSITNTMLAQDNQSRSVLYLHNVEEQFVKDDIETYLTVTLAKLSLSGDQIKQLAEQAGVLFIYAATAARYLTEGLGADTASRLSLILGGEAKRNSKKDREIDLLYRTILDGVLGNKRLEEDEALLIKQVLWTVVCAREPVTKATLTALLRANGKQISAALQPLRAVLRMCEGSDLVSILHASFHDFMLASERSGSAFNCDATAHNMYLAIRCFDLMKEQLRFNICNLETSYRFDEDVPDLANRVNASISSELLYACLHCVGHLIRSSICTRLLGCLDEFLNEQLLLWMEVLNLKGQMRNGPRILAEAEAWLLSNRVSDVRAFVHDARNFTTTFAANPVRQSTPHIYVSVLPLAPKDSKVWKSYWGRTAGLLRVDEMRMNQREGIALAMWEVGREVTAIAYSPDGTRIVFASSDGMIRLWDAHSGTPLGKPFKSHTNLVISITFSPDGTRIVATSRDRTNRVWDVRSGTLLGDPFKSDANTATSSSSVLSPDGTCFVSSSGDFTIHVWNVRSGTPLGNPLKGHSNVITSIAFSPDSTHFISGSKDGTIRVWDVRSATSPHSLFKGHNNVVTSVAFSFDGTRIVSGSWDCTIRVWNVYGGTPLGSPFEGHTKAVCSVAFSPDSTHIVSGSWDSKIRVWDAVRSRALLGSSFKDHSDVVLSIAFSSDGTRLVSGSGDLTVRIWDVRSGTPIGRPLKGHTGAVTSVAFSPDDTCVISGSEDCTICVWDVSSGSPIRSPLRGHTKAVCCVAFSPDGTQLVSGSGDFTVRVWDVSSGIPFGNPFEGHTGVVTSVAFSPDGARIASGSHDCTIWVWDAHSGSPLGSPLKGHTNAVTSVAFSPDGTRIASGSYDHTIRLWDDLHGACSQASAISTWDLNDQGWVVDSTSQAPLFWLPAGLRDVFPRPPNTLTISPKGPIKPDLTDLLLGRSWNQCYEPRSSSCDRVAHDLTFT